MHLQLQERRKLNDLMERYILDEKVLQMKKFMQHGCVSTFDHVVNVAEVSFWLNSRLGLRADEKILVAGAMLHDFYLYDWHDGDPARRTHGFTHPEAARKEALSHFLVDERTQRVIRTHMWPLTFFSIPNSREAVIVCLADKYCSLLETILCRKENKKICG